MAVKGTQVEEGSRVIGGTRSEDLGLQGFQGRFKMPRGAENPRQMHY